MSTLKGKRLEVQGYKHDGRMHRIWDSVYIVDETPEFVVAVSTKTKVVENNFRVWYTKEPAVMIYFKNCWWNIISMLKKTGVTYYVNLASPFILDNKKIKYIDYDLDIKLYPSKEIRLIDVKEYGYHKKLYNYGPEIDQILRYNIKVIEKMMKDKEFPFQDEKIMEYYNKFLEETGKESSK